MKRFIKILCFAICAVMLLSVLASCKKDEPTTTPDDSESLSAEDSGNNEMPDGENDNGTGDETVDGTGDGNGDGNGDGTSDGAGDPPKELTTVGATVMSFNIRYLNSENSVAVRQWDNRKEAVYDFILGSGAGIIGMQEVLASQYFDLKDGLAERYEVLWYASYENSNPQGNAVAYDRSVWQIIGVPKHFWLSPTPDIQSSGWQTSHYRSCINALFEHKETGVRLNVFVTHLDHKSDIDSVNGIKLILERMGESEYPVYLCGDFNCISTSEAYAIASANLQDAQKTALDSDEGTTYTGWEDSYTDDDNHVIDYCFFSKENVSVKTYEICDGTWGENNENKLSDHRPIMATVDISGVAFTYPDISGAVGMENFDDIGNSTERY